MSAYSELGFTSPWLNASGSLGFSPPPPALWNWPEPPGGFFTAPISLKPRTAAEGRAFVPFAGGFLMHTGLPNPGFQVVLRQYEERWARSKVPIWVHVLSNQPDELNQLVRRLENVEGVFGVEVGIPPFARLEEALMLIDAAVGELPLMVHFPLTMFSEVWVEDLSGRGAAAISIGPPRGSLVDARGRLVSGRLYGPALLPFVFRAVAIASRSGIPVIAGCGVHSIQDGQALLSAGAAAIMLDAVLWRP